MGIIQNAISKVKSMIAGNKGIPEIKQTASAVINSQQLWRQMYLNQAPWTRKCVKSLNLAATIAAEISRLITLEIKSSVDDEAVDVIYQREIMKGLRNQIEYGLALGGLIMKPFAQNGTVRVDFAQPSDFSILSASTDGTILEIIFRDYLKWKEAWYVRQEYHKFDEAASRYLIMNEVRRSDEKGGIGNVINDYSNIIPWADLEKELELYNVKAPLFGYFKPAVSNNVDTKSALGISIYARAADAIQRADEGLSAMLREFRVKEAKQYVSELAVKGGGALPYLEDDYYIKLRTDAKNGVEFFESYSPEIYVEKYLAALNEYKREIEDCIGLAHGTISDVEQVTRTATDVKMSKQRTYVLVTENQKNLVECLKGAVYAIGVWLKYPQTPPDYEVTAEFDDSVITDTEAVLKEMREDAASGLIRPEIYIAKKYGVTEEEAKKMMPESENLMRD